MPMQIIRDNITHVSADAIVNTANPMPTYGTGLDKAVYEAAGAEALLAERRQIGEIARGDIAVTPAFDLNARYIIHAVGPRWEDGSNGEFDILRSCYRKSLEKAVELGCESIAVPLIASGANRFPKAEALQIALEVINCFLMANEMYVYLVVFDDKSFELSGRVFKEIKAFVDQGYVDNQRKKEYPLKSEEDFAAMDAGLSSTSISGSLMVESGKKFTEIVGKLTKEKLLKQKEESFQDCLLRLMRERNLDSPDVYKAANLDRRMFSKLFSDKDAVPKKKNVIAIALALKLDLAQTSDFLKHAGYALSLSSTFDRAIIWCIEHRYYNIYQVNEILFECDLPQLGSTTRE